MIVEKLGHGCGPPCRRSLEERRPCLKPRKCGHPLRGGSSISERRGNAQANSRRSPLDVSLRIGKMVTLVDPIHRQHNMQPNHSQNLSLLTTPSTCVSFRGDLKGNHKDTIANFRLGCSKALTLLVFERMALLRRFCRDGWNPSGFE